MSPSAMVHFPPPPVDSSLASFRSVVNGMVSERTGKGKTRIEVKMVVQPGNNAILGDAISTDAQPPGNIQSLF